MPLSLEGSCRCGAVRFSCRSHTPHPYQRCYCSICRKTAGGGGYAINLAAPSASLKLDDPHRAIRIFRAEILDENRACRTSTAERRFCSRCGTALWAFSPEWPELFHPFASAIDTELPVPPSITHVLLRFKAPWVDPRFAEGDARFELYPDQSIEDWHKSRGLWID